MALADKYLQSFKENVPAKKLNWRDWKPGVADECAPHFEDVKNDIQGGFYFYSKMDVGEITIIQAIGNGGISAESAWKMFHNGTLIQASKGIVSAQDVFKQVDKAYLAYAKKHNLTVEVPVGDEVKTEKDEWKRILDSKWKDQIFAAIELLEECEKNKHIWNVDYEDIKNRLNDAWSNLRRRAFEHGVALTQAPDGGGYAKNQIDDALNYNFPIPSQIKKLENDKSTLVQYFVEVALKPMVALMERLKALKPHIEKGRKPVFNPNAKPAYVPPKSSLAALKKVDETYKEIMKEWFPKQVASYEDYINNMIPFVEKHIEIMKKYVSGGIVRRDMDAEEKKEYIFSSRVLQANAAIRYRYFKFDERLPEAKIKSLVNEEANEAVKAIQAAFIAKNLKKVTSIVGEKGNLAECKLIKIGTAQGTVEALVKFMFEDNSEFTVKNQVVTVWDARKPFSRYPATFHDVKFVSGKLHKMRSEEQMNKDFALEGKA